jgi:acyl-CoA thioesterase FadM
MNLFFRFLRVFVSAIFSRNRTGLLDVHTLRSAVWIGDQDPIGHMTNSRYSSLTDLAIMNYMGRTRAFGAFRKKGWVPIIQYESFVYWRSLRYPQKFEIQTRLVGWEGRYMCFHHQFQSGGRVCAESRMIARLSGRQKAEVTAEMALEALGVSLESPPLDKNFLHIIAQLDSRSF